MRKSAENVALNETRNARKQAKLEDKITVRPTLERTWPDVEDIPDSRFNPEEEVARSEAKDRCAAELAAVKEYLTVAAKVDKANEDALKLLAVFESEGEELKRAEMIARTGLSPKAYDAARKRVTRAAVHKNVRQRALELWLAFRYRADDVPGERTISSRGDGSPLEHVYANANQTSELASNEFDREFLSRK